MHEFVLGIKFGVFSQFIGQLVEFASLFLFLNELNDGPGSAFQFRIGGVVQLD